MASAHSAESSQVPPAPGSRCPMPVEVLPGRGSVSYLEKHDVDGNRLTERLQGFPHHKPFVFSPPPQWDTVSAFPA
ncbi:unnamed protein product [Boreogadus saida]